ncbi:uncharacterized protein LOC141534562 [Cotesia typhae]|uniref:uncharacterized protein LOC141534562 n=2 Tax=Cotesia typhae TaxID=2053667 RepID=UPI003D692457
MLPMTEDIGRLIYYLKTERKRCFKILEKSFNLLEWLNGLKLVSAFLLVFNRRRVGDIQNILISDFSRIECIDKKKDLEEFNLLDESGKKIAQKFFRVAIRGKKNRTVAVIAGGDIIKEIGLLIRHRISANVPPRNEYLFGLPNNVDDRIRVVNICKEMRLYSVACGAEKPELLRGTGLRKHVATKCMELELNDKALGDVMNHMGHSEKIHRDFYQQPTKSKTIVQVAKVLEAVQGPIDDDEEEGDDDLIDDVSDYIVISDKVNEDDLDENPRESSAYSPKPGCLHEIKAIGDDKNIIDSQLSPIRNMEFDENSELSNSPVVRMTADFKVGKRTGS